MYTQPINQPEATVGCCESELTNHRMQVRLTDHRSRHRGHTSMTEGCSARWHMSIDWADRYELKRRHKACVTGEQQETAVAFFNMGACLFDCVPEQVVLDSSSSLPQSLSPSQSQRRGMQRLFLHLNLSVGQVCWSEREEKASLSVKKENEKSCGGWVDVQ